MSSVTGGERRRPVRSIVQRVEIECIATPRSLPKDMGTASASR